MDCLLLLIAPVTVESGSTAFAAGTKGLSEEAEEPFPKSCPKRQETAARVDSRGIRSGNDLIFNLRSFIDFCLSFIPMLLFSF